MQNFLTSLCLLSQWYVYRLAQLSPRHLRIFVTGVRAILVGFWLGILSEATCKKVTEKWYSGMREWYAGQSIYMNDKTNRLGLHPTQVKPFETYFSKARTILVYGAGGGREVFALEKQGYTVHGLECNQRLVEYGNKFLAREGCTSEIKYFPPDLCPDDSKLYDGIIIGAGVIINIIPKDKRILFLDQIGRKLNSQGRILIGLCCRPEHSMYYSLIFRISNFFRLPLRRPRIELGDHLDFAYEHYFIRKEIESELKSAGFQLIYYDDQISNRSQAVAKRITDN